MLTITFTGWSLPRGVKYTTAAFRKAFGAVTFGLSGSIATGDITDGAVTPAKLSPGAYFYATSTYSTKTYSATMTPPLSAQADGVAIRFKATVDCDDGPILLTVNGLPVKQIFKAGGAVGLSAGDIRANQIVEVVYCAALASGSGGWLITGGLGNPEVFVGTGGGTANAQTCTCTVPAKSLAALAGKRVQFIATAENTAAMTLAIDGLTAKSVLKDDGQALKGGDIKVGDLVDVVYVSTAAGGAGAFILRGTRASVFTGVDAGVSDAYAITVPSFPAAWVTGITIAFKANTANTGAATLTVTPTGGSALSAVALKKFGGKDLDTNDILAGQWVTAVYDGTNLQVQSCGDMIASAEQSLPASAGVTNIAHGLSAKPRRVRWVLVAQGTTDHSFVTGDEVDVFAFANNSNENRSLVPCSDATNVTLIQGCANTSITIFSKSAPDVANYTVITPANWKAKCYYAP